jgi:hypothetical protein
VLTFDIHVDAVHINVLDGLASRCDHDRGDE